jgi:hypothetical protein
MGDESKKDGEQEKKETEKKNTSVTKKEETDQEKAEIEEMVKNMPPQLRHIFRSVTMSHTGPLPNPILEKINEKHIDKIIDYSRDDEKDNTKLRSSDRYFHLLYTILAVAFLTFLIIYLSQNNMGLLENILKIIGYFGAGVGSGYGLKAHIDKKKK